MTFASADDWERFRYNVKNKNRYVFCPSILEEVETNFKFISSEEFLRWLLFSLRTWNRFVKLEKGTTL